MVAAEVPAVPSDERLVMVDARYVGHRHPLRIALRDSRFPALHFPGVLAVEGPARDAAVAAMREGAATPDEIAVVLAGRGIAVREVPLGDFVAEVPEDAAARAEAERRAAAVDEESVRLVSAVKARDGFFTTFCVSPWSRYVARWSARRGLTPNQVTVASLLTALAGAAGAATGTRWGYVCTAIALYLSFVLDCADGQLARYSVDYSRIGSWLDATFDRVKEYAVYAGLAVGSARDGDDVWLLAVSAMALQTGRHLVDFAFNESRDAGADPGDGATARLSGRLDSVGWTVWARRMIILPIGERWALIAVLTALTTPRIVFTVLLIGCAFAACYTSAGRISRSWARRGERSAAVAGVLARLTDAGPIAYAVGRLPRPGGAVPYLAVVAASAAGLGVLAPHGWWVLVPAALFAVAVGAATARPLTGRLDWIVPPVLDVAEYAAVIAITCRMDPDLLPWAFGLVAAIAYHHYDTVYRLRGGHAAPPRALAWGIGGHEGRVVLLAVLAGSGASATRTGIAVLTIAVAAVVVAESVAFWARDARPDLDDPGMPASGSEQARTQAVSGPAPARAAVPAGTADGGPSRTGEPR